MGKGNLFSETTRKADGIPIDRDHPEVRGKALPQSRIQLEGVSWFVSVSVTRVDRSYFFWTKGTIHEVTRTKHENSLPPKLLLGKAL